MRIGGILRKWRTVNDYTVRDVADRIGVAPSTLVHIEQGKMPPHSETLIKVVTWLIGEDNGAGAPEQQPASAGAEHGGKADAQEGK